MPNCYTIGYGNCMSPIEFLKRIPARAVVIDVRARPRSSVPGREWASDDQLRQRLGRRYRHAPALGNQGTSAKWEPASLAQANHAIEVLVQWLHRNPTGSLCLLCAEGKPFDNHGNPRCHRVEIAQILAAQVPGLEIIHL